MRMKKQKMAKKLSVSSQRVKRVDASEPFIITDKMAAELAALEAMPDSEIDYSDIPEQLNWKGAVRGTNDYAKAKRMVFARRKHA